MRSIQFVQCFFNFFYSVQILSFAEVLKKGDCLNHDFNLWSQVSIRRDSSSSLETWKSQYCNLENTANSLNLPIVTRYLCTLALFWWKNTIFLAKMAVQMAPLVSWHAILSRLRYGFTWRYSLFTFPLCLRRVAVHLCFVRVYETAQKLVRTAIK